MLLKKKNTKKSKKAHMKDTLKTIKHWKMYMLIIYHVKEKNNTL